MTSPLHRENFNIFTSSHQRESSLILVLLSFILVIIVISFPVSSAKHRGIFLEYSRYTSYSSPVPNSLHLLKYLFVSNTIVRMFRSIRSCGDDAMVSWGKTAVTSCVERTSGHGEETVLPHPLSAPRRFPASTGFSSLFKACREYS